MCLYIYCDPAGLPNQGFRKKLNEEHCLSTRKRYVLIVNCFDLLKCLNMVSELTVSAESGV